MHLRGADLLQALQRMSRSFGLASRAASDGWEPCCRVTQDLIAWDGAAAAPEGATFRLLHSSTGSLSVNGDGVGGSGGGGIAVSISGADGSIELQRESAGLPRAARLKFPHLASLPVLRLPADAVDAAPQLLQGQLAVAAGGAGGELTAATGAREMTKIY